VTHLKPQTRLLIVLGAAVILLPCGPVFAAGGDDPVADFTFSPSNPVAGQPVQFTDRSQGGPDTWEWDFDDGGNSTQRNPTYTFDEEGSYDVELQVENDEGRDDIRMEIVVSGSGVSEPEASFSFSPSEPVAGQSVQFTDTSTGGAADSWEWDFDDGTNSSARNPTHSFDAEGSYEVTLTVSNSAGSSDAREQVEVEEGQGEPEASFSYSPAQPAVGQAVRFTDTSGGGDPESWEWDFDDGDASSAQNPSHSFSEEGTYEVRLTVENAAGSSDAVEEITIATNETKPQANFSFSPTNPEVGQTVRFTDTSGGGDPESWQWDFDDGDSSKAANPTHSFSEEGSYEVTLQVGNSAGSSDAVKEVTVAMTEEPPNANFSYSPSDPVVGQTVRFTDTSGGGAAEYWEWSFGDGGESTEQNPTNAYDEAHSYTVSLRVVNSEGSDTASKSVKVEIGPILKEITFIPAASLAAGAAGSFFQTDVDIENGDDVLATFAFLWLPRGADNKEPVQSDSFMLGPGASARYPNILAEVFGLSADVNGAIAIISDSEDLAVMSRTYNLPNAKASGTFGQAIPGVPDDELLRAGDRGRIIFMSQDDDFRANLGCVNGRIYNLRVFIDLYDPEGALLETKTMDLAPWSNKQLNKIFNAYAPTDGYAVVRSNTSGAAFYCYGSVLDNTSSDPTTITPVLQ